MFIFLIKFLLIIINQYESIIYFTLCDYFYIELNIIFLELPNLFNSNITVTSLIQFLKKIKLFI